MRLCLLTVCMLLAGQAAAKSFDRYDKTCWKSSLNGDRAYRKDKKTLLLIWDKLPYLIAENEKAVYSLNDSGLVKDGAYVWPKDVAYAGVDLLDEFKMGEGRYRVNFGAKTLSLFNAKSKKSIEVNLEACR